jgi:acetolactate synthase I/II/III large subunit
MLTGARWIAEYIARAGVPYAVGIPGHGSFMLTDALLDHASQVKLIPVMHEQSAVRTPWSAATR